MKKPDKITAMNETLALTKSKRALPELKNEKRLKDREVRIADMLLVHQNADFAIGEELVAIQAEGDYPDKTFGAYMKRRWERSRDWGYKLIEAFQIKAGLPKNVFDRIQNVHQTKALKAAEPEDRPAIIEAVAASGSVTAAAITEEIDKKKEKAAKPKKEKPSEAEFKEVVTDANGEEIPESLLPEWKRAASEAKEHMRLITKVKSWIVKGFGDSPDNIFAECDYSMVSDLTLKYRQIKTVLPFVLCPSCRGKKCKDCKKRGWVSEFRSKQFGK